MRRTGHFLQYLSHKIAKLTLKCYRSTLNMHEQTPSPYLTWQRPFTQEQLGRAITQATVAFYEESGPFTTRELFVHLQAQYLLPKTTYFAEYYKTTIAPDVVAHAEQQGGMAEWSHTPTEVGNRYGLTLCLPETPDIEPQQESGQHLEQIEHQPEATRTLDLEVARLILDNMKDHKHPDEYITHQALLAILKEQNNIEGPITRATLEHLQARGLVQVNRRQSRKHGRFLAVSWGGPKISRTWRIDGEAVMKFLSNPDSQDNSFVPTPLNRRERRHRHGRTAKAGRSKQK